MTNVLLQTADPVCEGQAGVRVARLHVRRRPARVRHRAVPHPAPVLPQLPRARHAAQDRHHRRRLQKGTGFDVSHFVS